MKKKRCAVFAIAAVSGIFSFAAVPVDVESRIDAVMARLTLEQKIG